MIRTHLKIWIRLKDLITAISLDSTNGTVPFVLLAGVSSPKHFLSEGGKEVTFGWFHDADFEGGAADFYCGVLGAAETVSVYGYQEAVAAAGYVQADGFIGGEYQGAHGEAVRGNRGEADHIGARGYDGASYTQGVGGGAGGGGYDKTVGLIGNHGGAANAGGNLNH